MHKETVSPQLLGLLEVVAPMASAMGAVLAGGTALALQLGHRVSRDLDFFLPDELESEGILSGLRWAYDIVEVIDEKRDTLSMIVDGVKLSFFRYEYPFVSTTSLFRGVTVAGPLDIASMKLLAIIQRGCKRDFIDLYFILQDTPFHRVCANLNEKFGNDRVNPLVLGKALVYFSDADAEPEPLYIEGMAVEWEDVKHFFRRHVKAMVIELSEGKGESR